MIELNKDERFLLKWLSTEDQSQYGECHGKALDRLIELGLAQLEPEDTEWNNSFIAKGKGIMYRAVSLTEKGITEAQKSDDVVYRRPD